jgi:FkbM family methyltransferase
MFNRITEKLNVVRNKVNVWSEKSRDKHFTKHHVLHGNQEMFFLVGDKQDAIQSAHASGKIYEPEECAMIEKYFKSGVFIDVGANVGNHTIYFAAKKSTEKLIAFEPNPIALPLLAANIEFNRLGTKVVLHRFALSNESREIIMEIPVHNLGGASFAGLRGKMVSSQSIVARCEIGDHYLANERADFYKIDVEGHEIECLLGLEGSIRRSKAPIFIEVSISKRNEVEELINSYGYSCVQEFTRYEGVINLMMVC